MPRSVQEIQNDIAKVKAEIALKNKYMNGYSAPTSNRGWGAYFQGDKSVHQKALDDQTAWARALQQQEFQAAEAEENRKLQEKIASMNKGAAAEDRQNEAYLQYQKYVLAREKMKAQGLDTSELDLQINHLADKFGFSKPQEAEYDLNKDVNYVLAQSGAYDAINNPLNDGSEDALEYMRDRVAQFHTPESAKELARLDREIKKRDKAIAFKEQLEKDKADYWDNGNMSDLMIELGFEEAGTAGNRHLIRGKKVYRNPGKKGSGTKPAVGPISN
jgi:hypothetical protein